MGGNGSATVVKLGPGGEVLGRFQGGGLHRPLGLASDSRGNVWVSNSTWVVAPCVNAWGVAVDPLGNVWLANNWKNAPIRTNPGGYQIVAYLGLAAPVKTPQIGVPERP